MRIYNKIKREIQKKKACFNKKTLSRTAFITRLKTENSGNIAVIIVILLFFVIVGFIALGTDSSRLLDIRTQLRQATDSATLALAKTDNLTPVTAQELAERIIKSTLNMSNIRSIKSIKVDLSEKQVKVHARIVANMGFSRLIGIKTRDIVWESAATLFSQKDIEVVLVLDNTGSMKHKRVFKALKKSAKVIISELHKINKKVQGNREVSIGIVPFATYVNVNKSIFPQKWIDATPQEYQNWDGCVLARQENDLDLSLEPPSSNRPSSLIKTVTDKHNSLGNCPMPLTPLTKERNTLFDAIDRMKSAGTTNIVVGAVWGLRLLSPNYFPGEKAAEFNDPKVRKYMIVLTDGRNEYRGQTGAYGSLPDHDIPGAFSEEQANRYLDKKLKEACSVAQKKNVTIFTIAYALEPQDAITHDLFRHCATNDAYYFNAPTAESLEAAFKKIVDQLTEIRLTL